MKTAFFAGCLSFFQVIDIDPPALQLPLYAQSVLDPLADHLIPLPAAFRIQRVETVDDAADQGQRPHPAKEHIRHIFPLEYDLDLMRAFHLAEDIFLQYPFRYLLPPLPVYLYIGKLVVLQRCIPNHG